MVRWLVMKGAKVTGHELQLAAFGGYHRPGLESVFFVGSLVFGGKILPNYLYVGSLL